MEIGSGGDEGGEAALGDLAGAEDDHAAAGEAEAYGVGGVFGHLGGSSDELWVSGRAAASERA
ncbi:hypothetical protein GCM10010297_56550 [Streptomyces malachitofuscus]|nr:hypothetical protein GCM10010297_56550 [Streptomyces malachitofuscus]